MNAKKVLPLVIAAVLGLIAARMVVSVVRNRGVISISGPNLPKVVVAKINVQAGQELTAEDLTVGELALQGGSTATFHDPSELIGRVAITSVIQGQAIQESLLAPKGSAAGLNVLLPPGMRAETVEINEITGVAGYLSQGCRVDILQTLRDDVSGEQMGRTIVPNILVMALGQKHVATDDATQAVRSVTLAVTPHQAELIELASMSGRPRLVLRNSQDHSVTESDGVLLAELRGHSRKGDKSALAGLFALFSGPARPTTRATAAVGDPFAGPTTRPSWDVKLITAGDPTIVKLNLPSPAVEETHTDQGTFDK